MWSLTSHAELINYLIALKILLLYVFAITFQIDAKVSKRIQYIPP